MVEPGITYRTLWTADLLLTQRAAAIDTCDRFKKRRLPPQGIHDTFAAIGTWDTTQVSLSQFQPRGHRDEQQQPSAAAGKYFGEDMD